MLWAINWRSYDVINFKSFISWWNVQFILFVNVTDVLFAGLGC